MTKALTKAKIDHEWYIDLGGDVSTSDDNKLYLWVNQDVTLSDVSHANQAATEKYSDLDPRCIDKRLSHTRICCQLSLQNGRKSQYRQPQIEVLIS